MIDPGKAWSRPTSVAELFIRYWQWADAWKPEWRLQASLRSDDFDRLVRGVFARNMEEDVLDALERFIPRHDEAIARSQIMSLLRLIDDAFYRIHPRVQLTPPGRGSVPVPAWLRNYRELRKTEGAYAKIDNHRLVPRGPLLRVPRSALAANADTLADRFSALSLVPIRAVEGNRVIELQQIVVPLSALAGVPISRPPGHERIVHIPIMEAADDLQLTLTKHGECEFLSYGVADSVKVIDRLRAAASHGGGADILMAPEFTVDEATADALVASLKSTNDVKYRLIAAGTGNAGAVDGALPYNEMRLMNGFGVDLWRQRKLWPACIGPSLAQELGCKTITNSIFEATSSGDELVVADLDSLGRVMVLICQDFKLGVVTSLLQVLQPDWVLVPVMDHGVEEGRWTHQRAFELSENTQTRFLVGCGLSMAARIKKGAVPCIMAVGPKAPASDDDEPRVFRSEHAIGKPGEAFATIEWRSDGWLTTGMIARR